MLRYSGLLDGLWMGLYIGNEMVCSVDSYLKSEGTSKALPQYNDRESCPTESVQLLIFLLGRKLHKQDRGSSLYPINQNVLYCFVSVKVSAPCSDLSLA
jgi:hypothetical protein